MVIWLIGISGAGKTTLGRRLENHLRDLGKKPYLIDGDQVRDFFENDLGYTESDRKTNVKRIMLGAHFLDQNNILTIVCNISPFEELRAFARRKIKNYRQIYLKRSLANSEQRDIKNVYQNNATQIVGKDIRFDEPKQNDLVLDVDHQTVEESFAELLNFVTQQLKNQESV